jgi:hypothetical protein
MGNQNKETIDYVKYSNKSGVPGYVFVIVGLVMIVILLTTVIILK